MKNPNTVININDVNGDSLFYEYYNRNSGKSYNPKKSMLKFLQKTIDIALSKKEKLYFTEHFINGKTVNQIAYEHGRHKSTVSREITKAKVNLREYVPLYFIR